MQALLLVWGLVAGVWSSRNDRGIKDIDRQGFDEISFDYLKTTQLANSKLHFGEFTPTSESLDRLRHADGANVKIPLDFDSRDEWPQCPQIITSQAKCGSGWAITAAGILSDRLCIQQGVEVVLSTQWLVDCDTYEQGCFGGALEGVWKYLILYGAPAASCLPYTSGQNGQVETCPQTCLDGSTPKLYYAATFNTISDLESIQTSIMLGGSVGATLTVYQDLLLYRGGIYAHKYGDYVGTQSVKIIGWGLENYVSYWIAANSWGTNWGEKGFFRIAFGQCGIDSNVVTGDAAKVDS